MDSMLVVVLTWTLAISSGLMAGTYLAFSAFIMRSFASLGADQGSAAMNAINRVILRSAFMPLFFGSSLVALLLAVAGLWHWGQTGAGSAVFAGLVYVVGMFVTTAAANVPLNNALAAAAEDPQQSQQVWQDYLVRWTRWNSLRTIASTAAFVACIEMLGNY
ncbi:MAG: anthrone oxygenase family protein [Halioglobus sp.]|nr:anthrone oxygenase family protein [Halioglobus sp.]